jgi:hypothetical protein
VWSLRLADGRHSDIYTIVAKSGKAEARPGE